MKAAHVINQVVVNTIEVESLSFAVDEGILILDTGEEIKGGWAEIGGMYLSSRFYPTRPSNSQQIENRQLAYQKQSDPIFFMYQRGTATEQEWKLVIENVKSRYPYYFDVDNNLIEAQ
jgi:hypothetical protein